MSETVSTIDGDDSDNRFEGRSGDDRVYGMLGIDTLVYTGLRDEYSVIMPDLVVLDKVGLVELSLPSVWVSGSHAVSVKFSSELSSLVNIYGMFFNVRYSENHFTTGDSISSMFAGWEVYTSAIDSSLNLADPGMVYESVYFIPEGWNDTMLPELDSVLFSLPVDASSEVSDDSVFEIYSSHIVSGPVEFSIQHDVDGTDTVSGIQFIEFSDQVLDLETMSPVSYSGSINYWKSGSDGSQFTMTSVQLDLDQQERQLDGASDSNGDFAIMQSMANSEGELSASFSSANDSDAVNLQDAILVLKQIVGLESFSAAQSLAADFDQNGSADLNDAIGILKHVVGLPSATPEWGFLHAASGKKIDADTSVMLSPVGESNIELIGVLSGDVDGSWVGEG